MTLNTEQLVTATKVTTAMDHIKNNRIEYLLAMILCHFLGVTDKILSHTAGVCF